MKNPTTPARGYLLSAVGAAALLLCHTSASAFSLGRMTVQSALGENLRAEIEVTNLSPEEAATLQSAIASGEAFRAAGVDFNPALSGAEATLQRRADGRAVIRIAGTRAVSEPFVDLILNFTWSGGRLQRSYTLLIDPPTTKAAPAPAAPTTSPVLSSPPAPRAAAPVAPARPPVAEPVPPKPVAAAPRPASKPATPASEASDTYSVRAGDTLSGIARRHAQSGVSLDQMLVGLYRGNPDAFAGNNMNRLKAGAKLTVPDAQTAGAISSEEARQVIQAQSSDFAAFRQRLAQSAPAVKSTEPERQASGKVEAAVQDRKAPATGPADELKLSRPSVKPGAEAKVSKETERKAAEARVAELSRNVQELKKLSQGTAAAVGGAASAPAKPGVAVPAATASVATPAPVPAPVASAPVPPVAASTAPVASSVASAVAEAASVPASQPAKPKPKARPPVVSAPVEEEGFLSSMMGNPIVPVAGISIVALLAGLGVTRLLRRRKQGGASETSFVESRMQPDSFFGVSGGQRVDTRDGASSSSSLSYSLSQLDAIGDVDPVAEADVYLAYGRDLQAEEILKEALRADGGRVAIRSKLLEVYAKRADARSFETQARQVLEMTGGVGDEWERAKELGRQVDPANELYQQGGPITEVDIDTSSEPPPDLRGDPEDEAPRAAPMAAMPAAVAALDPSEHGPDTQPSELPPLDLDIDLAAASKLSGLESTRPLSTTSGLPDLPAVDDALGHPGLPEVPVTGMEPLPDLAELPPFEATPEEPPLSADEALPQPEVEQVSESKSMDFDFGDLSLDLGTTTAARAAGEADEVTTASPETLDLPPAESPVPAALAPAAPSADDFTDSIAFDLEGDAADPLQRKVELADEFRRIGDVEGARDLLEEVVSKAAEPLRSKAQAMLDELG